MSGENVEIYLDKIKLGALIVEKELSLIELYNTLINEIRLRPDIKEILKEYPTFHKAWQSLSELYDFLEYDYLKKLDKTKQTKIKSCLDKYKNLKELSLDELRDSVNIVREIMSISKFHDVVRKGIGVSGLDKLNKRYKLGFEDDKYQQ